MSQSISKTFNFKSLVRFSLPTIVMMIFTSLYTIVDGMFVSRLVGTEALSAINITYPFLGLVIAIAIMFASGGSAVVATQLGEGKKEDALKNFSLIVLTNFILILLVSVLGILFMDPLVRALGAKDGLIGYSKDYLTVLLIFAPAYSLQLVLQSFYIVAGKPKLGLLISILSGVTNAILDYVFMGPLGMGIAGAAYATAAGYLVSALFGLYFFSRSQSAIHFKRPSFHGEILKQACFNGSSEMVTNLSTSVVTLLFNIFMMKHLGTEGVAAITIVFYFQFLMVSLFMGYSMGVAPVISYNYGSKNYPHLKKIFKINWQFIIGMSLVVFAAAQLLNHTVTKIFTPVGSSVYNLTIHGFALFAISFIFAGINIYASSLFTALSNGKVSAIISFARTLVFISLGIILLPMILGVDGIWWAVPFAEVCTLFITFYYVKKEMHLIFLGQ